MKSVLQQHKRHRRQRVVRKVVLCAGALLGVLTTGTAILFLLPQLSFHSVAISGAVSVPADEITRIADRMLQEKLFYLFPRRHMFLFRPAELESSIIAAFPIFSHVEVRRSWRAGISIAVSERSHWGIYCMVPKTEEKNIFYDNCYYIAEDGTVFAEAPSLTGNALLRVIDMRTEERQEAVVGREAVDRDRIERIQRTDAWLREHFDSTLREAVLGRPYESDMELTAAEGWYVRLDDRICVSCVLDDLAVVLAEQVPDRTRLEYADIRFDGKVFYKLRE